MKYFINKSGAKKIKNKIEINTTNKLKIIIHNFVSLLTNRSKNFLTPYPKPKIIKEKHHIVADNVAANFIIESLKISIFRS
jgi:hypothetical protein